MEIRQILLSAALTFIQNVSELPGVSRIALLGSLTTPKLYPKDVDVLVTISEEMDLALLATQGRKLLGKTQAINHGTDVFLCDPSNQYLGRICLWKICAPGIRKRCDALHCGLRTYLHDDFQDVRLDTSLIASPPIIVWPHIIATGKIPKDVEAILLKPLRAPGKTL